MQSDPLARLRSLLEEERQALRAGDLERLEEFLTRKQDLAAVLTATKIDAQDPEVMSLRALARSNASMCDAARRGIRAAIDRFAERTRVARQFDTYDRNGQRQSFLAGASHAPRRA